MDKLDTMLAEEVLSDPTILDCLGHRQHEIVIAWLKRFNDAREVERANAPKS